MEHIEGGLVDIQALSKELMKSILGPYIQFDPSRQEFLFTEEWDKLGNNLKLLTYLVARKGVSAAGHLSDEEAAAPKTIEEQTHLPSGSISYTLKVLFDNKLIDKTELGKYFVPSAKLLVVKGMIERAGKEESPVEAAIKGKRTRSKMKRGRKASE